MMDHQEKLTPGQPFFTVSVYDKDGFYGAVVGPTLEAVRERAAKRSATKGIVLCTLPFEGTWAGGTPDVSLPADFKVALVAYEKPRTED